MTDKVEKLSKMRRIMLMMSAASFLTWQVPMMDKSERLAEETAGWAGLVSVAGFAVWILILVYLVGPWSRLSLKRDVNAALNDELVRANRGRAYTVGYIAMMLTAATVFALTLFEPVKGVEAAHLVLVVGVVAPMFCFAALERS